MLFILSLYFIFLFWEWGYLLFRCYLLFSYTTLRFLLFFDSPPVLFLQAGMILWRGEGQADIESGGLIYIPYIFYAYIFVC